MAAVGVITIDHFYPETFKDVPVLSTFVDCTHIVKNYFFPPQIILEDANGHVPVTIFNADSSTASGASTPTPRTPTTHPLMNSNPIIQGTNDPRGLIHNGLDQNFDPNMPFFNGDLNPDLQDEGRFTWVWREIIMAHLAGRRR